MLGGKPLDKWIEEYSEGHQHPMNRLTHSIGIPMIMLSLPLFLVAIVLTFVQPMPWFWILPVSLFVVGWILQFIGHAYEGKPPEFFKDPRFLLIGGRWWFKKTFGQKSH